MAAKHQVGALYFCAGRAGAGKSTFARQLSVERHAILVCEDQWLARLFVYQGHGIGLRPKTY